MRKKDPVPETQKQPGLARTLRQRQTDAERALWARLRNRQLDGAKFRRQQPLGPYIVDFVSLERRIIVEVDGGQHGQDGEVTRDEQRTVWLASQGYRVVRFWNNDVLLNMDGVLERIMQAIK